MSEFALLGVYATPLEACDAIGVKYEEKGRSAGFTRLNLIHGGKGDASIRAFTDSRGGIVFNHKERTKGVWFDDYKSGQEMTEAQKRKINAELEAARRQAEALKLRNVPSMSGRLVIQCLSIETPNLWRMIRIWIISTSSQRLRFVQYLTPKPLRF